MKNLGKLFSFRGRVCRSDFWLVLSFSIVILVIIDTFTRPLFDKYEGWLDAPLIIAILIPFFWINIATARCDVIKADNSRDAIPLL